MLQDQPQRPQPCNKERAVAVGEMDQPCPSNKGKAVAIEYSMSSTESDSSTKTQLWAEAPEFIPTLVYNPSNDLPYCELRWQGIHLSLNDIKRGHVDPAATLSDPISS